MIGMESDFAIVWMMLLRLGCLGFFFFVLSWIFKVDILVFLISLISFKVFFN